MQSFKNCLNNIVITKQVIHHWFSHFFSSRAVLSKQYTAFKSLLENDKQAHNLIAQLEEIHHNQVRVDIASIERKYEQLSQCTAAIINHLMTLSPLKYKNLRDYFRKMDSYIRLMLSDPPFETQKPYVLSLRSCPELS